MPHWLLHFLGLTSASGMPYLAWSGALSDLGELAIIGGLVSLYRKHMCVVKGCPRIARHVVPGTDHRCCARHTPGGAPTHGDVLADHRSALEGQELLPVTAVAGETDEAVLAELRGLRADFSGMAEAVRGALLTSMTAREGRRP